MKNKAYALFFLLYDYFKTIDYINAPTDYI